MDLKKNILKTHNGQSLMRHLQQYTHIFDKNEILGRKKNTSAVRSIRQKFLKTHNCKLNEVSTGSILTCIWQKQKNLEGKKKNTSAILVRIYEIDPIFFPLNTHHCKLSCDPSIVGAIRHGVQFSHAVVYKIKKGCAVVRGVTQLSTK